MKTEDQRAHRDQLAIEAGARHAHPHIRSMYSKSRGTVMLKFAQLFKIGWNSCYNEMNARFEAATLIYKDQLAGAREERNHYMKLYHDAIGKQK